MKWSGVEEERALSAPVTPHWRVPIVAHIANPKSKGSPFKLIGQIDRLVDQGDEVLIVDYKSNRQAPTTVEGVEHFEEALRPALEF